MTPLKRPCELPACDNEFAVLSNKAGQRFCSAACAGRSMRSQSLRAPRICAYSACGRTFISLSREQRYCNRLCSQYARAGNVAAS
jgi:hypothetical protein